MKTILLLLTAVFLSSCATTGSDLFIAYTGTGVEIQNTKITAESGKEDTTATGVGYDLKAKTAYVTYASGRTQRLRITGAGFGGGTVALVLEGGTRIRVNTKTGEVVTEGPVQ